MNADLRKIIKDYFCLVFIGVNLWLKILENLCVAVLKKK